MPLLPGIFQQDNKVIKRLILLCTFINMTRKTGHFWLNINTSKAFLTDWTGSEVVRS